MLDVHMYACSTYGGTDIQGWYKDRSVKSQTREGGSPPHTHTHPPPPPCPHLGILNSRLVKALVRYSCPLGTGTGTRTR